MTEDPAKAAKARTVVASLLIVEAVVIAILGVWLVVLALQTDSFNFLTFLGVLFFVILGSGGLFGAAIAYRRGKYFGRAPAVLANLIALGVVSYQVQEGLWIIAIPLALLALATLVATLRATPQ